MKAAQVTDYRNGGTIAVQSVPEPPLVAGAVRVRVAAASLNPWDSKIRNGSVTSLIKRDLPITLGGDFCGTIIEIGEGVTGYTIGETVFGSAGVPRGSGALASEAVVPVESIAALPATVSTELAAASVLVGVSAWQAVEKEMNVQPGQKILIHGAAGGIGSVAVQIAKKRVATVYATAKGADSEYVMSLGADDVIAYDTERFEERVRDCDAVFDTVGGDTYRRSFAVVRPGGVVVSMVMPESEIPAGISSVRARYQQTRITTEALAVLAKALAEGEISIRIARTFALKEAAAAFDFRESGAAAGKVVIRVAA